MLAGTIGSYGQRPATSDLGVHCEDKGRDPVGAQHAVERRGDRARSAQGRRSAGQAGRQRHVPQRRAPGHRRSRRGNRRAAVHRRARGCRRGHGGRRRGHLRWRLATTSCSASSRRAAAVPAVPPGTATCATWVRSLRRACSSPMAPAATTRARSSGLGIGASRHVRPPHRRQRGQLHQDRQGHARSTGPACWAAASSPAGARRSTPPRSNPATPSPSSASVASAPTPSRAPSWPAPSGSSRDRPGRVQAREGDGVRRHAHLLVDRRGDGAHPETHVGNRWLRQGHHDDGRGRWRSTRPGVLVGQQGRQDRRHQHPPHRRDRSPSGGVPHL